MAVRVFVMDRWLGWCDTCKAHTEPGDASCTWCADCGDPRED